MKRDTNQDFKIVDLLFVRGTTSIKKTPIKYISVQMVKVAYLKIEDMTL